MTEEELEREYEERREQTRREAARLEAEADAFQMEADAARMAAPRLCPKCGAGPPTTTNDQHPPPTITNPLGRAYAARGGPFVVRDRIAALGAYYVATDPNTGLSAEGRCSRSAAEYDADALNAAWFLGYDRGRADHATPSGHDI